MYTHNLEPVLFNIYGELLYQSASSQQDYLLCQKFYQKSIKIDHNYGFSHANYAVLLDTKLNDMDKAEIEYRIALNLNPNNAVCNRLCIYSINMYIRMIFSRLSGYWLTSATGC